MVDVMPWSAYTPLEALLSDAFRGRTVKRRPFKAWDEHVSAPIAFCDSPCCLAGIALHC